jgi:hypothetical protein
MAQAANPAIVAGGQCGPISGAAFSQEKRWQNSEAGAHHSKVIPCRSKSLKLARKYVPSCSKSDHQMRGRKNFEKSAFLSACSPSIAFSSRDPLISEKALVGSSSLPPRDSKRVVKAESGWQGTLEDQKEYSFNLDEYLVTLEKPIGIRFAQREDGKVYVEVRLTACSLIALWRLSLEKEHDAVQAFRG